MEKRQIYIGFSYPKKFKIGAKAISIWTASPYSHTYIRFESQDPRIPSSVYHAAHGMVHFRPFDKFLEENDSLREYEIEMSIDDRVDILAHCMSLSGEGYGYSELAKIVLADLHYWITERELKLGDSKGYICSELVGKILNKKFNLTFNKPLNLLKPSDIDGTLAQLVGSDLIAIRLTS